MERHIYRLKGGFVWVINISNVIIYKSTLEWLEEEM